MSEFLLFSQIDASTAAAVNTWLEANPTGPLLLRVNSPGGSVFDAVAIYQALSGQRDRLTSRVEGLAASMASVVTLAASKVQMHRGAMLMIHNPSATTQGDSGDLRKMADLLDAIAADLANTYAARSQGNADQFLELMAKETWLTAEEAKHLGFVDEIIDFDRPVASGDIVARLAVVTAELNSLRAAQAKEREAAITASVDTAIRSGRVKLEGRAALLTACLAAADGGLALIAALPAREVHDAATLQIASFRSTTPAPTTDPYTAYKARLNDQR